MKISDWNAEGLREFFRSNRVFTDMEPGCRFITGYENIPGWSGVDHSTGMNGTHHSLYVTSKNPDITEVIAEIIRRTQDWPGYRIIEINWKLKYQCTVNSGLFLSIHLHGGSYIQMNHIQDTKYWTYY